MVLQADDVAEARRVAARLAELQRSGVLYDLFPERTSLTYGVWDDLGSGDCRADGTWTGGARAAAGVA